MSAGKRILSRRVALLCAVAVSVVSLRAEEKPDESVRRVPWTTSRIVGTPEPPRPYESALAFPKLQFQHPTLLTSVPSIPRLFLGEQAGRIVSFPIERDVDRTDVFVDLTLREPGVNALYGFAFHPRFAENDLVYICYVSKEDPGTIVSEFRMSQREPPVCDVDSERRLISWRPGGHNGGCLKFGPDGYLYIATGDATAPFPPDGLDTGQDNSDLLSAILRIDVDHPEDGRAYRIPADNPFVRLENTRPEVYAYGFRNPWKMSFDSVRGDLWVGDVGWELREMIYRVVSGGNYGWSIMEGSQPVRPDAKRGPTPILPPVVDHSHSESRSVTGGVVYYGADLQKLRGAYVYGDFDTGKVWSLRFDGQSLTHHEEIAQTTQKIVAFGVDPDGELYFADYGGGKIHRLQKNRRTQASQPFPRSLSETGLFSSVKDLQPAAGVIPYSVAVEPWADHAVAERLMAIPGDEPIAARNDHNVWVLPPGTALVKTLSLPIPDAEGESWRRIETQLLHRDEHQWHAYSYEWNDDQTDAVLVDAQGAERTYTIRNPESPSGQRQQTWRFHSRVECLLCHNFFSRSTLGITSTQLNIEREYDGVVESQLQRFQRLGLLPPSSGKQNGSVVGVAPLPDPHDGSVSVDRRARAYLHANCAHCHRRNSGGTSAVELPFEKPLEDTNTLSQRPLLGAFGVDAGEIVSPGEPYRSVLFYRVSALGAAHMPRLGSRVIDARGVRLLHEWIRGIPPLPESGEAEQADVQKPSAAQRSSDQETLIQLQAEDLPSDQQDALVDQLLQRTGGALALTHWLATTELRTERQEDIVARGADHPNSAIRMLFARFVPEEARRKQLGTHFELDDILTRSGDAERGRALFFSEGSTQCRACHRIGGAEDAVGPNLAGVGAKYRRAELLQSIVEPSKKIEPNFVAHLLVTKSGAVHNGLLVRQDAKHVVVRDSKNALHTVAADEVAVLSPQANSLMPEGLLQDITAEEAADLLEFLMTLRTPAPIGASVDDGRKSRK